jgi:Rho termination factor, N-terminal domain
MDSFLQKLTEALRETVLVKLGAAMDQFATNVAAESKGTLTKDQVLAQWAKVSDIPVTNKSPPPRTKTDKEHKCQTILKSGVNMGNQCGANCVLGKDTCSRHVPKEEKTNTIVAASLIHVDSDVIPADAALKLMTVPKLKELAKSNGLTISSKARKDEIISELVKLRDTKKPAEKVEKAAEKADEADEEIIEEEAE